MSCPDTVSQEQIDQAVSILQELFPQELTGIYLYGSAVLDGLRPRATSTFWSSSTVPLRSRFALVSRKNSFVSPGVPVRIEDP